MYKRFDDIDSLMAAVVADKRTEGTENYLADRYPIRFILFDNFPDGYEFVNKIAHKAYVKRIERWLDQDYPDTMITYSKLADRIRSLLCEDLTGDDMVIAPFSEIARFYDNMERKEFDALVNTVRSIENTMLGYKTHRRVYIPLIGLSGKMETLCQDRQSTIWCLQGDKNQLGYRLVLTCGTIFGVKGVSPSYTLVNNVYEWLNLWTDQNLTQTIVCTSPAIYANAVFAQPDNAFTFCRCTNVHDFLVKGLKVDGLEFISYKKEDNMHWEQLAAEIDINGFEFEQFFNKKYDIHELADYDTFVKTWFESKKQYDRWLLCAFYLHKFCNKGYICQVLKQMHGYTNVDFLSAAALAIFSMNDKEKLIEERKTVMEYATQQGVVISTECQSLLKMKLQGLADEYGYASALRYVTVTTDTEKELLIEWLGKGKINVDDVKDIYPMLYHYMQKTELGVGKDNLENYISLYKSAKISNTYTEEVKDMIIKLNGSVVKFDSWYQDFKTVCTLLDGRNDIEVFFWIDGLGVDWIPFVSHVIEQRKEENFYLNEVIVGRALLPTKTSVNKESLLKLSPESLPKIGDIDEKAHHSRKFPLYVIDDMIAVKDAVDNVLTKNPGRKIAIVSDHGMTFLSQLCQGFNLVGVESDHGGRIAVKKNGKAGIDEKYFVLEDGKTMCALHHESLCAKIPFGCGCHGGCTPEEVLVPIFIISNQENKKTWNASLKVPEIAGSNPVAVFTIKGMSETMKPFLIYDGKKYAISKTGINEYTSDLLTINSNVNQMTLQIGQDKQEFKFSFKAFVEEDDLFV